MSAPPAPGAAPTTPSEAQRAPLRQRSWKSRMREPLTGLIFILPMLVLFVIFRYVPTLGAGFMSFTDYKLYGGFEFVGLDNYTDLIGDTLFLNSVKITLLYAVIYVPLIFIVAMGTALLLNTVVWGQGFFRGAIFLPYVTSFVLAGIIWLWVYQGDGLINGIITQLGGDRIAFVTGGQMEVLSSLAVVSVWKGFGYSMLILMAGLKSVPEEYHEAAKIDGAGAVRRFFSITLPLLKPVIFFVMVIETIAAFQVFDTVYVMTGGGPARASNVLVYMLYQQGFQFFNFGYAAAIGVALFVIVFLISIVQRFFLDREVS
ncbi:multiple sugar transport system permease protein [Brachybacterium muris]|nr:sugar ABC transporter permease [Brachybacterium muris]MBM7501827.1 multiple sugar transport system permease protein [Brachybacterium muris]MCT2261844.1 sugar ABC transporter permease [Brachybacterium muris]MCT2297030.1 sugar ABC transporter permease [Brachybacterium muris]